jgi:2TM domain
MTDAQRAEQVTRDSILKLLTDEENAKVSTAEAASRLTEGAEYLDLEHLDQGVQRAKAATAKARMGHVLPRSAVSEETWRKILAQLAGETRMNQTPLARVQETVGTAVRRLYHDPGFVIHFAAYLAVNILLIAINLATTPGKYWFYWPLLGWGLGIAGHAFCVLRHSRRSLRREQRDGHRRPRLV